MKKTKLLSLTLLVFMLVNLFVGMTTFAADDEYEIVTPPEGAKNLVINGSFDNEFEGFEYAIKEHTSIVQDGEEHGNVVRVERTPEWDADKTLGVNSSVTQSNIQFEPGAEYQLTVDLKIKSLSTVARTSRRGPMFMIRYEDKSDVNFPAITDTKGKWKKFGGSFVVPEGIHSGLAALRFFGAGEIYWDNLEIVKISEGAKATIKIPSINYTDWETGTAKLDFKDGEDPAGYEYHISIKDGEEELFKDVVPATEFISYEYSLNYLKDLGKAYTMTIDLKDPTGAVNTSLTKDIYRYDRPTHLSKNGFPIDNDGNEFYPTIGYTCYYEDLDEAARLGIDAVVSLWNEDKSIDARFGNIDQMLQWLDEAWYKHGVMSLIRCYGKNGDKSNGVAGAVSCPENIELLKETVNAVKDHPGVLGYLVLDEPYNYESKVGAAEITRQLEESYHIIRSLDKDHLIMHTANKPEHWDNNVDYSDVIIADRYPDGGYYHSIQFNTITKAKTYSDGKKPVWNLIQAGKMSTKYEPKVTDLRQMIYQTMFAKGDGIGYIATTKSSQNDGLLQNPDRIKIAEGFANGELDDAVKAFITGEYPTFSELVSEPYTGLVGQILYTQVEEDFWYKAYKKDGQLYMLVMNNEDAETPVEIKLTSTDGNESVGEFTATVADNFNEQHTVTGNNVFKTTLAPHAAVLYKIDGAITSSAPNNELAGYEWAADAINTVTSKGIANKFGSEFKPGEAITRADFAGWLIRTLGLTADATENFSDVAADEYYAKEIAIGKAIGVLNGVGNNNYDPKAPISRQDLMVICTRGMKLVKEMKLDTSALDVFSDNALIADYAKEGITGMVTEGIIKGNTDGTINPLGNTTRAEAAVIMDRILNWK